MTPYRLSTKVRAWGPDGAYVDIPREVGEALGARGRLDVTARVGGVEFRKSLALRPGGVYRMALGKSIRERAGVKVGDDVEVQLEIARS